MQAHKVSKIRWIHSQNQTMSNDFSVGHRTQSQQRAKNILSHDNIST